MIDPELAKEIAAVFNSDTDVPRKEKDVMNMLKALPLEVLCLAHALLSNELDNRNIKVVE